MPTILLAEDDKLLREAISAYLRSRECVVWEVSSAEEALAALDEGRKFDLLVTDINMSGAMDGWELAERARAQDGSVSVVYTTSGSGKRGRQVAGSTLLPKPYKPQGLMDAIIAASGSL